MTVALPPPQEPFVDPETGRISDPWYRVMRQLAGPLRVQVLTGLPTSTDILSGTWDLVKDSSGGSARLTYNDAGDIKTVALTT
jgi:hypothetical protein